MNMAFLSFFDGRGGVDVDSIQLPTPIAYHFKG
jgi:hypothetical protein